MITVHDMIHELYPELFPPSEKPIAEAKLRWCQRATSIIAVSECTKDDLVARFGVEPELVSVVHHGIDPAPVASTPSPWSRPFVLYVGNRSAYKNFEALLHCFAETRASREFDLVVFGGEQISTEERQKAERLGVRLLRASGPDACLSANYRHARALVYPSLYEGFGLPPLEAMAHGCPVASSTGGSLPEVIGDAATFFDPADLHDMAAAVDRVCFDEVLRTALRDLGATRAARYRWSDTAEKTVAVYSKTAGVAPGRCARNVAAYDRT